MYHVAMDELNESISEEGAIKEKVLHTWGSFGEAVVSDSSLKKVVERLTAATAAIGKADDMRREETLSLALAFAFYQPAG
ncbi:hypothetical protein BGX23_002159 [Mortierella sp. AD031]|nr:hypothetical protein BGX23_002159 [Mortierella sp. AD031]